MLKMYVKYSWRQHNTLCLQTHWENINIENWKPEKDMKRLSARLQTCFTSEEKKKKKKDIDFIEQTGTLATKL